MEQLFETLYSLKTALVMGSYGLYKQWLVKLGHISNKI